MRGSIQGNATSYLAIDNCGRPVGLENGPDRLGKLRLVAVVGVPVNPADDSRQ